MLIFYLDTKNQQEKNYKWDTAGAGHSNDTNYMLKSYSNHDSSTNKPFSICYIEPNRGNRVGSHLPKLLQQF